MARHYVIQDWSNSATWSGEMIGDRLSKSEGHHFLKNGMANTKLYEGDEDAPKKAKVIPVADRILPQRRRVATLTQQMQELVADYKAGNMSIEEYSTLLAVVSAKRKRALELLNKAVSVKAPFENVEQDSEPVKASVETTPTTHSISSHIKQKACQVWAETRMFLVGSVAACAGLMWLAN